MHIFKKYEHDIRPWGSYERLTLNEQTTVKIVTVKPNEAFSLQSHVGRDERWKILGGGGRVRIGDEELPAKIGDEFLIERDTTHRAEAGADGLIFLEISTGEFNERDIKRLEDRYGRV
ncbi:MAG: hypothetical protein A2836_03510 [Candidatus Taylorbacteria bacterium RIFCSPHIGHO2_01_FULL_45_63]|uniref:Mannose-6-phosphate isomerase type II C-terminal domain-containing protein n=1 Tax=Candidatus Taylorbacteria bacterium RIFCSPHIGHO2_02_FULL_45_35 TaxID=1802311 RepID=A0A1G2MVE7_9BACT|nr:MAG: hypothetical protein A2836_03510 [Candidatus Taylorbacteria bacterium RIFCSPHIGHO2_01_FULL_45_63]OHA27249.1 MAG: hypothetical protein A3D56_00340 [Candidatus Taylorbacteria bacterium RIFCSPHIGHO2_02_FULL_45_35]OHA33181.1 MAG: hypothetical protein A3A22_00085 [Candidatus Taylorbacteria bacterium RIFCSPLOWO2_01_FULL_45_34b]